MIFKLEHIQQVIKPDLVANGLKLTQGNVIIKPNLHPSGKLLTSSLQLLETGDEFKVYIRLVDQDDRVDIKGDCTCAQKHNCEHVAAVLLHTLDEDHTGLLSPNFSTPITGRPIVSQAINLEQCLIYVIHVGHDVTNRIEIACYVARKLDDGGYSKTIDYRPSLSATINPVRFLSTLDLEIIPHLARLERDSSNNHLHLTGTNAAFVLTTILSSGHCHFGSVNGPKLSLGKEIATQFFWQFDQFGLQHLNWDNDGKLGKVVIHPCLWYFNVINGVSGPLACTIDYPVLEEINSLSPVGVFESQAVQKRLLTKYPHSPFPRLHTPELVDIILPQPVPLLHLLTLSINGNPIDVACLKFDYGDRIIEKHEPPHYFDGKKIMRLKRDFPVEQDCAFEMVKLGLHALCNKDNDENAKEYYVFNQVKDWIEFQIKQMPQLVTKGWKIEIEPGFRHQVIVGKQWYYKSSPMEEKDWFSIKLGVIVDGQEIDLLPLIVSMINDKSELSITEVDEALTVLKLENGQQLSISTQRLNHWVDLIKEYYRRSIFHVETGLRLNRIQSVHLSRQIDADNTQEVAWQVEHSGKLLAQKLQDIERIPTVNPPDGLQTTLRPYQQSGLDWLQFLKTNDLAGILADDMGLGKTIQTLANILIEKQHNQNIPPSLIIVPTSLVSNWTSETRRFAPSLSVLNLQGPKRGEFFDSIEKHDLVISTYPLLLRDAEILSRYNFHYLILDEAHQIKNPKTKAALAVRGLQSRYRLCLTGTPMENHLGELWALFDFLLPGLLGTRKQFYNNYQKPIEKENNTASSRRLSAHVRPFMLRRTKDTVAPELPLKTEIIHKVALQSEQRELYESVRISVQQQVFVAIKKQGIANSRIAILDALLKLRQVCCDPRLVKLDQATGVTKSVKLDLTMDLLNEMLEEGRRILIFSQFTSMLALIEKHLNTACIKYALLTGKTRSRETQIARFQNKEVSVFLISLKAGGVGLNLTSADTVIHYDPWWNPSVERQATDRAHRIGQTQPVFVYKLITEGTVEEKIVDLQQHKQSLIQSIYKNDETQGVPWLEQDLEDLFAPISN